MKFAFLDESGDPGVKGSNNLVLTLMCTSQKKKINKIVRITKQRLLQKSKTAKWLSRHGGEIKFYGFPDKHLLRKTLTKLAQLDLKIYSMAFKKDGIPVDQKIKPNIVSDLFRIVFDDPKKEKFQKIIADLDFFNNEKTNRFLLLECSSKRIEFSHIDESTFNTIKNKADKFILEIEHRNSRITEELQALDLISGAIFLNEEHDNSEYFNIIKTRIINAGKWHRKK